MTTETEEKGAAGAEQTNETEGQRPQEPAAPSFTSEQQAYIDRLIDDRLKRDRARRKQEQEAVAAAAAEAAEAKRLEEEQKWQELARKHEAKAAEATSMLKDVQAQLERSNGVLESMLETRKQGLPEAFLRLLDDRDVYDQLAIVTVFLEALPEPDNGQAATRPAATTPTPPAQGTRGVTPDERRARAARTF